MNQTFISPKEQDGSDAPFGPLGNLIDIRTYRRWLPEKKRRETLAERNARVVNYNISLALGKQDTNALQQEADLMYDMLNNLKVWPSGRTAWVGGTSVSATHPMSQFNCFHRDTEFITVDGIKSFNDFSSGDRVTVLTKQGSFKEATVNSFGKQKLTKLTLKRRTSTKEVYVTDEHNWFVYDYDPTKDSHLSKKTTSELVKGDTLAYGVRRGTQFNITPCKHAIQHGIVYGDGYKDKSRNTTRITLHSDSVQLFDEFSTGHPIRESDTILNLPYTWKDLPSINANNEYLLGFLSGWFAADGSLGSSAQLFNKSKDVLTWARGALAKVGIYTSEISLQRENNPFTEEDSGYPLYAITLFKDTIPESFFIREKHIQYFSKTSRVNWKVESIESTDREETVWCVTEPTTSSFVLAGGVVTGNCSFVAINRLAAFTDLFELLMVGAGVGFRVHTPDINQLPRIANLPKVEYKTYTPVDKSAREEVTYSRRDEDNILRVTVGDSRQGWIDALDILFGAVFDGDVTPQSDVDKIEFNFDNIRPIGERIKGFGGTASGPKALQGILSDVLRILEEVPLVDTKEKGGFYLRSIDCMDIACAIAKGVVAGSARRSALICLFEEGDTLCANAKKGLYTDPSLSHKMYRAQSNNTENLGTLQPERVREFLLSNPNVTISSPEVNEFLRSGAPSVAELTPKFDSVKSEGEPGFDNWERMIILRFCAARNWRPNYSPEEIYDNYCNIGTNPCHEILLSAGFKANNYNNVSFCNLTTIPIPNHLLYEEITTSIGNTGVATQKKAVSLDMVSLEKAFRMAARIGLRQTCVEMPKDNMNEIQQEERLLGVSSTGWRDVFDALDWSTDSDEVQYILNLCRFWANDEATSYAKELGVQRPLLVTTIKPEGTASQVFGTSSGLHWDWSPYYTRRVRMSGADPLAKTLIAQGFPAYPELYDLQKYDDAYGSAGTLTILHSEKNEDTRKWYQKVWDRVRGVSPKHYSYSDLWDELDNWDRLKYFEQLPSYLKEDVLSKANTVVFEFPVKSLAKVSQKDVSALEQLENMKNFTQCYTDHMPSSTITVKEHEWDDVIQWVANNWESFTTASFLPYYGGDYPLLPYEEISKQDYEEKVSLIPSNSKAVLDNGRTMFKVNEDLLQTYEIELEDPDDVELTISDCSSGCPLR